jgi:hypothetical protein
MFWNLGVWKRVFTKGFVTFDVFIGCSLFVPPDLTLIVSCVTKSFLYSGSLTAVSMVGVNSCGVWMGDA